MAKKIVINDIKACHPNLKASQTDMYYMRLANKIQDNLCNMLLMDDKDYEEIIVPNIIRCGGIPKDKLIIGKTYIGDCRNAREAVWDGEKFTYMRTKFGSTYPETINHFQDDDGYDLFVPLKIKDEK